MTEYRNPSRATWTQNVERLRDVMKEWGIPREHWDVETECHPNQRNTPYSNDARVTVRYRPPGSPNDVVMQLDSQLTASKNLNSIIVTIEEIRMHERRGLGGLAQSHYLALAAPASKRDPYEVLGILNSSPLEVAEAAYKALARSAHPDAGGSEARMAELNAAIEEVRPK